MDIIDVSDDRQYLPMLLNAQRALETAALKKGQKPLTRTPRRELVNNQLSFVNSAQLDTSLNTTVMHLSSSFISHIYPPCVASVASLTKTYLHDLRLEINHRGSYLLLRTITPPNKMTAIMSIIEDENGGCDLIQLYNMDQSQKPEKLLPEGQVILIKEPYYKTTVSGGTGVRVDHLSDAIFLGPDDERVPIKWQPRIQLLDKDAIAWKEEGNDLFRNKEFHEAIKCYTNGLKTAENNTAITSTIRLNRSAAFLAIRFHEKALEDCDYILGLEPNNEKALFRASKALYQARKFKECKSRLTTVVRRYPENKEAKADLLKVYKRLQEENTGKYNFQEMRATITRRGPVELDHADFVGPVCIQNTRYHGRGLFTTRDVKAGELLLCSKAFAVCYAETTGVSLLINVKTKRMQMGSGAHVVREVVKNAYNNPSSADKFFQLHSGDYQRVKEEYVDGGPVVDTFLAEHIRELNSFGFCPLSTTSHPLNQSVNSSQENKPGANQDVGIWLMPSYINHSCWGSSSRSFIGDMMIVRATQDMKNGQEITHTYCYETQDVRKRQKTLMNGWGFYCNCPLCAAEGKETPTVRKNRQALVEDLSKFASVLSGSDSEVAAALPKFIRLNKSLEATYKKPAIIHPRVAMFDPLFGLGSMYARLGRNRDIIDTMKRLLEALGFKIEESQGKPRISKYGLMIASVVDAFVKISTSYLLLGDVATGVAFKDIAADMYEIEYGEKVSFGETFKDVYEGWGLGLGKS